MNVYVRSIGSTSFGKTLFTMNKMCIANFKKMNIRHVKIEALAWLHNRTLGISKVIDDYAKDGRPGEV